MKEIIKWLRKIERLANETYLKASTIYADDAQFKKFLKRAAEDEAWHYHVMGCAAKYLTSKQIIIPAISIDKETGDRIVKCFSEIREGLEKKNLSKEKCIEKIVEVELSEWNDIFLYVVNFFKEKNSEFKYPAARIQTHIKKIEYFVETIISRSDILKKIKALPPVWVENILIVDDEEIICEFIRAILNRNGNIDVANNGVEALKLIENKYYKLVISDIDMPEMDGLTLFKEAIAKFPSLISRFLFMSGDISSERRTFFNENQVKFISKPMAINILREEASKIVLSK